MGIDGERGETGQKEIERKFLVAKLPDDLSNNEKNDIRQGYLHTDNEDAEVRIRQKGGKYYRTEKIGHGLERQENEQEISQEEFEELWPQTVARVEKTRYEIPIDGTVIELDVYHGNLEGRAVAEIELSSADARIDLSGLDWLGEEVTGAKEYSNAELAQNGWPESEKETPRYELEEGVTRLIEVVQEKIAQNQDGPIIVQIAGGSASGKTSQVADRVKIAFGDEAQIISMDNYYRGVSYMNEQAANGNDLNWDQPEALNLEELRGNLARLKRGEEIEEPIYSFVTGEREGSRKVSPAKVIIAEGLFALNDSLVAEGDIHAFVDIGAHGRIIRRLLRDVERTGQNPKDILEYFADVVEPMHEKYVQSTIDNASIIISNEYSAEREAGRSGSSESQLKFPAGGIDAETLRKASAEVLGHTQQIDKYYNSKDRDLSQNGESLRIREEAGRFVLGYKGPDKGGQFRNRPKFEFEVDPDTGDKILSMYKEAKNIKKDRTIYQLDGVIFSFDNVKVVDDKAERDLGNFIEIRSSGEDGDKIEEVMSKLGLKIEDGMREPYSGM